MSHLGYYLKRIQVFLPIKAHEVVERLGEEQEISQSRVVSDLVVDALNARGALNNQQAIHQAVDQVGLKQFRDNAGVDFQKIAANTANTDFQAARMNVLHEMPPEKEPAVRSRTPKQPSSSIDDDDLKLLKNQKMLKELGLL